ncbi:MAG: hypothetical protein OEV49_07570 [candidate division Zixibacteria bacterium]|nr:hypothetical protein [candidate division Zixibacteria bacterium]MDH3936074.1 hypothetical protein [candidate division Zixibacteria bacterium]MDH4032220.1 hypothetical protein [candidate division Zixibacteria bacterium]
MQQLTNQRQPSLVKQWTTWGQVRPSRLWAFALVVILAGYFAHAWSYHHYVNDDAYITFRYSRSLADGLGPFFNLDESVEGYTSFSMMVIVAGAIRVLGEQAAAPAAKAIGVLSGALSIIIIFWFTRFLAAGKGSASSATWWAIIAATLVALNPCFALNSTSGLETTLFAFLLTAAVVLATIETTKRRWYGSGFLFAAGCLTRPEGLILWSVFVVVQLLLITVAPKRPVPQGSVAPTGRVSLARLVLSNGIITLSVIVAHVSWRLAVYEGEWLPNTYYAKLGGFLHEGTWSYIAEGMLPAVLGPVGLIITLVGLGLGRRLLKEMAPMIAVATTGCLLPLVTGKDWMPGYRLLIPYLPLVACSVAVGWGTLFERFAEGKAWFRPAVVLSICLALWLFHGDLRQNHREYVDIRSSGYQTGHIALAQWLNSDTHDPARPVALMDIGLIGYLCPQRDIIDITGLTDRFIAKCEGGFLDKRYDPRYILDRRPEFVVLTFTAPGDTKAPLSPQAELSFWTPIERRIYYSSSFQSTFVSHDLPEASDDNLHRLAHRIGAEQVFEHTHPDARYLLAVFRNQELAQGGEQHVSKTESQELNQL